MKRLKHLSLHSLSLPFTPFYSIMLLLLLSPFTSQAQTTAPTSEELDRSWRQTIMKRYTPESTRKDIVPLQKEVATKDVAKSRAGMPNADFWFPGEWEEVQAVVLTPCYRYISADSHYQGYDYRAIPIVPGWADVYRYVNNGWSYVGVTSYTSIMDTTSAFAQVSFYLMDAIQLGGAQAWVRVEAEADTTAVLSHLAAKGLRHDNVRFLVAPGNAYWYRDCGPICFYYGEGDTVGMLDFEYSPGRAMDDSLPVYIERQFGLPNFTTSIEWEGGNCLVDGAGTVFSSDKIYSKNGDNRGQYDWDGVDINSLYQKQKNPLTRTQVDDSLSRLIGTRATHILPAFKFDGGTGHIDLYADMLDENQFVFSKMPDAYRNWYDYAIGQRNMDSLCSYHSYFGENYRCDYIPFPSTDNGGVFSGQRDYDYNYTRTYSNHTFVNNVLIQPCFSPVGSDGMPTAAWDRANIEKMKKVYAGYTFYCVDVREFDGTGGAIHCITKQIPAEHPIRILHNALHGNTGHTYSAIGAPVLARITNVDGIDTVQLFYRFDGGPWQEVAMMPDVAHQYAAVLPTTGQQQGDYTKVEYYISATSHAGKTITKPMTASQGGYYTFYLGENPAVGIQTVTPESGFGQFYPNPASEEAHLRVDMGEGASYSVTIVDAAGRTVHSSSLQASGSIVYHIKTALLPSGMYSVVFQNGSERVVRKLLVK